MRRGRKPKPTMLRLVEGNAGRRKVNRKEPKPAMREPSCPKWIGPKAREVWDRTLPMLRYMRVLTEADGDALTCYSLAYARWRAAEEFLNRHGLTQRIRHAKNRRMSSVVARPEVAISKSYAKMLRDYQGEFGLTPSARTRIEVPMSPEEEAEDRKFFGPKPPFKPPRGGGKPRNGA